MNAISPTQKEANRLGFTGALPNGAKGITKDGNTYSITLADGTVQKYNKDGSIFTPPADTTAKPAGDGNGNGTGGVGAGNGADNNAKVDNNAGKGNGASGAGNGAGGSGSLFGNGFASGQSDFGMSMFNADGGFEIDQGKFMKASAGLWGALNLTSMVPLGLGSILGQGLIGQAIGNFLHAINFNFSSSSFTAGADDDSRNGTTVTAGDGQPDTPEAKAKPAEDSSAAAKPAAPATTEKPEEKPQEKTTPAPAAKSEPAETKAPATPAPAAHAAPAKKKPAAKKHSASASASATVSASHSSSSAAKAKAKAKTPAKTASTTGKVVADGKWKGYKTTSKAGVYVGPDGYYYRANASTGKIYRCTGPSGGFKYSYGENAGTYSTSRSVVSTYGCNYGNGNDISKEKTGNLDTDAQWHINGGTYNIYLDDNHPYDTTLDFHEITNVGHTRNIVNPKTGDMNPNAVILQNQRNKVYFKGNGEFNKAEVRRIEVGPKGKPVVAVKVGDTYYDLNTLMKTGAKVKLTPGTYLKQG